MNIFDLFNKSIVLDHASAPGLMAAIEEIAAKAKTSMPVVRFADTSIVNAAYSPVVNTVFITKGMTQAMDSKNLHLPPSNELKAVIAHELGHKKFAISRFGSTALLVGGLPLAALAAYYLIDKTNRKIKHEKASHPDRHPQAFWNAFQENLADMGKKGAWQNWKDFNTYASPIADKAGINLVYGDDTNHWDVGWGEALLHQSKVIAVQAAALVPALLACRPIAIADEFRCDKFSVAIMGDSKVLISAFNKMIEASKAAVNAKAKTPLQKTWAQSIGKGIMDIVEKTALAHPKWSERIARLEKIDPVVAARAFHL